MQSDLHPDGAPPCAECHAVRRLRFVALRLGADLGWEPEQVAAFAAGVAERPWEQLGVDELLLVIEEFWVLCLGKELRRARRGAGRGRGGRRVRRP